MIQFEEGEQIIHVARRHWFVILGFGLGIIIAAIIPAIIDALSLMDGLISNLNITASQYAAVRDILSRMMDFYPLWLLVLWVIFFIEWTDYYLDVWIITDRRILDVEQKGFFYREVTSFSYNQVQDITVETHGFIQTMFHFGLLEVQTAGHNRNIIIKHASNPEIVRSIILKQQNSKL